MNAQVLEFHITGQMPEPSAEIESLLATVKPEFKSPIAADLEQTYTNAVAALTEQRESLVTSWNGAAKLVAASLDKIDAMVADLTAEASVAVAEVNRIARRTHDIMRQAETITDSI